MVGVTLYVSITTEESVKSDHGHPVMECLYGYRHVPSISRFFTSFFLEDALIVSNVVQFCST